MFWNPVEVRNHRSTLNFSVADVQITSTSWATSVSILPPTGKSTPGNKHRKPVNRRSLSSPDDRLHLISGNRKCDRSAAFDSLIVNTPEKTKILDAIYREYDELSYAVRLPLDLNSLHRCNDGQEDHWPQFCENPPASNATCYDTSELGSDRICLRQVECAKPSLRLACEFTLPGSPVLTASKFRQCPKVRGLHQRLTIWAWILIAVGAMLLLLLILGGVLAFLRNSHRESPPIKRPTEEAGGTVTRTDSASEPMLVRSVPMTLADTGYLEPQPLRRAGPSATKQDDTDAYL